MAPNAPFYLLNLLVKIQGTGIHRLLDNHELSLCIPIQIHSHTQYRNQVP
jgi:hypothetical protein